MPRVILHADANSFYATVECLYRPECQGKPLSVCGDPEKRHGIVLASNQLAKRFGVKTGMAVWQAKQACPELVAVAPDFALYKHFSRMLRDIYEEYSDRVESFGLDECWLDLSNPGFTIEDGERKAHEIRQRVKDELGITVSVGVSDNKIFAKLGSDLKKPDAVTVVHPDHFRETIWPLPASELLYVGPKTTKKLMVYNILTIGDLANAPSGVLKYKLGKNGLMLQDYANGLDRSPVKPTTLEESIGSVGNSITPPHDIRTVEDARCIYYLLAESVGARMRDSRLTGQCVSISVRTTSLISYSCQRKLNYSTNVTSEIAGIACQLFEERFPHLLPLRSVGVSCSALSLEGAPVQMDLFGRQEHREKLHQLDCALDAIRQRYGNLSVLRGIVLAEPGIARVDPKDDHTIHPVPFFSG